MLESLLDRVGGPRRLIIAGVGLGFAALILYGTRIASAPEWVPAITNAPLQSTSELTDRLSQAGIAYRLERGGADIMVAQNDLAKARVTLAKDGLPGGGRPGLEIFDRPSWGWNDFTQRVNYRRALEGELERTIGRMRGIDRAEVHIAISEQTGFRRTDDHPATASVLIALQAGGTPTPDIVQGIAHLVSSSVDGLSSDNVSIHDESGRQWSESGASGAAAALSGRQLRMQQDVERYLEKKAEELVARTVGPDNARVQVAATINFDQLQRTTQSVDPERQALSSEQKAEITPGAQGGAASTTVANNFDNTKSTEVFSGAIGNIKRLTVAVLVNDVRLPSSGPTDTLPRFAPRPAADLARIETLVRTAVGVDTLRGDAVSVVSLPFDVRKVTPAVVEPPDLAARVQQFQRPVLGAVGLVLAFVVALLAMRSLKGGAPAASANATLARAGTVAGAIAAAPVAAGAAPAPAVAAAPAVPPAPNYPLQSADTEIRDRVVATVDHDPDAAARLAKAWIKEG